MSEVSRPPDPTPDPENLRRLREQAQRRLEQEAIQQPYPAPVYGSPPIPPRWFTAKRLVFALLGALLAAVAWFTLSGRNPWVNPAPVYGGPPPPSPQPPAFILKLPGLAGLLRRLSSLR